MAAAAGRKHCSAFRFSIHVLFVKGSTAVTAQLSGRKSGVAKLRLTFYLKSQNFLHFYTNIKKKKIRTLEEVHIIFIKFMKILYTKSTEVLILYLNT